MFKSYILLDLHYLSVPIIFINNSFLITLCTITNFKFWILLQFLVIPVFLVIKSLYVYFKGEAVQCFQCSSHQSPKGEDNCGAYKKFDKERMVAVECNSDESVAPGSFCMKITQQGPRGFICKYFSLDIIFTFTVLVNQKHK